MYMRDLLCEDFPTSDNGYNYWSYTEDGSDPALRILLSILLITMHSSRMPTMSSLPPRVRWRVATRVHRLIWVRATAIVPCSISTCTDSMSIARRVWLLWMMPLRRLEVYGLTRYRRGKPPARRSWATTLVRLSSTMYRFIMNDLNLAEEALGDYTRSNKAFMDRA